MDSIEKKESKRNWLLLLLALLVLAWSVQQAASADEEDPGIARPAVAEDAVAVGPAQLAPAAATSTGPEYGVAFMSSAEEPADSQQYANALATGATWNRWPIYWFYVEQAEGEFRWAAQDAVVRADLAHGLELNAVLLGTPCFYRSDQCDVRDPLPRPTGRVSLRAPETAKPPGLYEPIFNDGSDEPGAGKEVNEDNVWARFVFKTVDRYRPGGHLAQTDPMWPDGGVTVWEIWNEPDLAGFWDGTEVEFARLLKVAYLAAKQADPHARIMFGGLAYFEEDGFYEKVLRTFDGDAYAPVFNYFHDIVGVHNYLHAWSSWWYVYRTAQTLAGRGLEKEIWMNESGLPAWNDYPGPVWDPQSAYRGTMLEQADFVIQSAFYATFAGADAIFHFQLYDGCGNQPYGTDFPPHDGGLCEADGTLKDSDMLCAGDAFGLFRNPTDAACFRQHPAPETPRPAFAAFQVLTTYLQEVEPLWRLRPGGPSPSEGSQEWIAFFRPATKERILGLWARYGEEQIATVPAVSARATLVSPDGQTKELAPDNQGNYTLALPGATNQNAAWDRSIYPIGGRPYLLVETDEQPPATTLTASAVVVDGELGVYWSGDDGLGAGLQDFTIIVAVDGGTTSVPWLTDTRDTRGTFPAEIARSYTFHLTARDRAGNVSEQQTVTVVAQEPAATILLPVISR